MILGGLGYGSYSFGRHVLSTRLFGSSVVPNSGSSVAVVDSSRSVTRKTDYKGSTPHVQIEVMDADSAGPGPEAPSLEDLRRSTADRDARDGKSTLPNATIKRGKPRRFDAPDAEGFEGDGRLKNRIGDEDRPRRRRRRKRTTEATTKTTAPDTARETIARRDSARSDSDANNSNSDSGATVLPESGSTERSVERNSESRAPRDSSRSNPDSGRSVSSGSSSSEERPTRRRRRVRSTTGSSSSRERSPARESPVPVAEGSGSSSGGESPVPQPE